MPSEPTDADALIAEGMEADTSGWDFDRFPGRLRHVPPDWDYTAMVGAAVAGGPMLDLGTGGGEWLARWVGKHPDAARPVVATEGWAPNVPVAGARLRPLGVNVVHYAGATDNVDQPPHDRSGALPFASATFGTVINRHESYRAAEVARILRPGGTFLTQQVGTDGEHDLRCLLDLPPAAETTEWTLRYAVDQAAAGGLTVVDGGVGVDIVEYRDIAPLVWYLRQVPWTVPDLDLRRAAAQDRLRAVQRRIDATGPIRLRQPSFWLRATRRPD